ncbi:MAG: sulfate ABC transporter substrate-binding protein [Leptolyngbyaceae cyanobacterium bins.349]|nr:sulfate ABC transporter substrate-binding protein [Leptolyngbyaceae cyanobacterium bins.349]
MIRWHSLLSQWERFAASLTNRLRLNSRNGLLALFVVGIAIAALVGACGDRPASTDTDPAAQPDVQLTLVAYTVPRAAYDAIIPKFQEKWKTEHGGQNVTFGRSFGASGAQTRAIIDGLDADVVHLAVGADVNKLVTAGFVSPKWTQRVPNQGIVGETVAAIITRAGNPKKIQTFADLTRSDVTWVTADPKTSGGARWNFFALWNYAKQTGADDTKAQEFVTNAYKNVGVLARDARESTDAFANQGQGDALVNYENEVILANQKGENLEYVIPDINISIDTPATMIDKNVDRHGTRAVAQAFVEYLFTPEAQREFARVGFRPLGPLATEPEFVEQFPPVQQLGSIADFGGWQQAQKAFDDGGQFDKIRTQIAQS